MPEPDLARQLLQLAGDDELAARSLLAATEIADAIIGFHAQQAVEKAIKAVLSQRDVLFPYTHDLDGLLELLRDPGSHHPDELARVESLTPYGVTVRCARSCLAKRYGEPSQTMDRTTVSRDWHKHALQNATLRDMPLHALRHTAAAWLAAGNSLMYVQPQLGHADTSTTEHYYGHLERHVLGAGALATEDAITRAAVRQR
jgi:HEPN domain-containing protein